MSSENYESNDKNVSHPSHYQSDSGLEAIDVIEAFTSDLSGIEAVDTANVIKYILRWKKKNGLQDLEKAMWYLQHLINRLKKPEQTDCEAPVSIIGLPYNGTSYEIIFPSYKDAENVLTSLNKIIAEYGCAVLNDLYDIAGVNAPVTLSETVLREYIDKVVEVSPKDIFLNYGWRALDNTVRPITASNGYSINLPDLTFIDEHRKGE